MQPIMDEQNVPCFLVTERGLLTTSMLKPSLPNKCSQSFTSICFALIKPISFPSQTYWSSSSCLMHSSPMSRGALVVFEGADRSGKTTQTVRLTNALREAGIPVAAGCPWRFPDRTTDIGKMINAYLTNATELDDNALHLLFSANRWEKVSKIKSALSNGETVILDRYAFSGVAYSTAKGLDSEWCKGPDAGLPKPDAVVYLDLRPEAAARRGDFGIERYERKEIQKAVAEVFKTLQTEDWKIIDADADQDTVFKRISDAVMPIIKSKRDGDVIPTLWS